MDPYVRSSALDVDGESLGDTSVAVAAAETEPVEAAPDDSSADRTEAAEPTQAADPTEGTTEAGSAEADGSTAASSGEPDDISLLRDELATAMQATARGQHERIMDELERRQGAEIEAIRARSASEAGEFAAQADRDLAEVEAWAAAEVQRIASERQRRRAARQQELTELLAWHGSMEEREIEGVEESAADYRARADAFFESLVAERDPLVIAELAARAPIAPRLGELGAAARARAAAALPQPRAGAAVPAEPPAASGQFETTADSAADDEAVVSEARLIAVMEPFSATGEAAAAIWLPGAIDPAAGADETTPGSGESAGEQGGEIPSDEPAAATAEDVPEPAWQPETPTPAAEPVLARTGSGTLLSTIPASRPFAWLRGDRRNGNGQDRP